MKPITAEPVPSVRRRLRVLYLFICVWGCLCMHPFLPRSYVECVAWLAKRQQGNISCLHTNARALTPNILRDGGGARPEASETLKRWR